MHLPIVIGETGSTALSRIYGVVYGCARPASKGGPPEVVDTYQGGSEWQMQKAKDDIKFWAEQGEEAVLVKLRWERCLP